MIRIVKSKSANKVIKFKMCKLFVDCYYDYFKFLNIDRKKLYKVFFNAFNLNNFYLVLLDNDLIGMGACCDGASSIRLNKFKAIFNLGLIKGKRLYRYFNTIFEERDYAFDMDIKCGMIEYVAVCEKYRNSKIGYTLINHIMCDNDYSRYLAKVADNNVPAKNILENIGFEIFDEEKATGLEMEHIGVSNYLYMISENPKNRILKGVN